MFAYQTSRSNARAWSAEMPIGDPHGGSAYGQRCDVGSVIGAVAGPLIGGIFGSEASSNAADAQVQAANNASATQLAMFNANRADLQPWRTAGQNALAQLVSGTQPGAVFNRDFSMDDFQSDPGYNFRLSQGIKALNANRAVGGLLQSGGTGKALINYGQEAGSQEYGNAFNRYMTQRGAKLNALQSLAGLGQSATAVGVQQGADTANALASNILGGGNARAAGYIGGANAINSAVGQGVNFYNQNQLLNAIKGMSSPGGAQASYGGASLFPDSYSSQLYFG